MTKYILILTVFLALALWYLQVPRSPNSKAPQRFEYVDGELIGWVYD